MDSTKLNDFIDSIIAGNEDAAKASFHTYLVPKVKTLVGGKPTISEAFFNKLETSLLEYTGADSRIKLSPGGKVRVDGKVIGHIEEEDFMAPGYDPDKSTGGIVFVALNGAKAEFDGPEALYKFLADRFLKNELVR